MESVLPLGGELDCILGDTPPFPCRASLGQRSFFLPTADEGTVYFEVHSPGVYRDLFGTLHAFDPLDQQMPLAVSLPAKVTGRRLQPQPMLVGRSGGCPGDGPRSGKRQVAREGCVSQGVEA